jgi:NADH-quinone oxidoreductase subunit I
MAGKTRVMKRPGRETSYVRATLKGMALTFRHLMKAAGDRSTVTMQYPEEKWALSPRWRGTHVMEKHEDGRPKCVACGLCPTICPANCIRLVPGEDDQGNRYPIVYEIDEFRCIFCGMCQEVCPVEAIHVGQHYENAEYTRDRFVYDLERLMAQEHPSTLLWDPADPAGE